MPSWLLNLIATIVIPFLVQIIKKWVGGNKYAPVIAIVLAVVYVTLAKLFGANVDINNALQAITLAFGISGASVLGYDVVKKIRG